MTSKAGGRAALLLATGIWIGLGAASQAATATDGSTVAATTTRHSSHHLRKYVHRKAAKVADKTAADKNTADASADEKTAPVQSSQMPASVANANAELTSPVAPPTGNIQAMTDRANNIVQGAPANIATAQGTGAPVVSPDQLNDLDRALQEGAPAATPVALASADDQPAAAEPAPAATASPHTESSTWDQTSLIGKIFIGFGALLTMASAARMFMA